MENSCIRLSQISDGGRRFSFSARRGAGRFRLWRRSRCRRWARLLHAGRHAAYGLGVMNEVR